MSKPVPSTDKAGDSKKKTFEMKDNKGGLEFEHLKTVSSIQTPSSKSSYF
jgi:hypothetical protein